jgi:hypothetical protein
MARSTKSLPDLPRLSTPSASASWLPWLPGRRLTPPTSLPYSSSRDGLTSPDCPLPDTEAYAAIEANRKVPVTKLRDLLHSRRTRSEEPAVEEPPAAVPNAASLASSPGANEADIDLSVDNLSCTSFDLTVEEGFEVKQDSSILHTTTSPNRRTRRRTMKKRRTYVKGVLIDKKHVLYTLSIAMMLGLRQAVFEEEHSPRPVAGQQGLFDFAVTNPLSLPRAFFYNSPEISFPPRGSITTLPHSLNHTFKFKTYCVTAFSSLRTLFGVSSHDFLQSVCGSTSFIEFVR